MIRRPANEWFDMEEEQDKRIEDFVDQLPLFRDITRTDLDGLDEIIAYRIMWAVDRMNDREKDPKKVRLKFTVTVDDEEMEICEINIPKGEAE